MYDILLIVNIIVEQFEKTKLFFSIGKVIGLLQWEVSRLNQPSIGFIGEAAFHITGGLASEGVP